MLCVQWNVTISSNYHRQKKSIIMIVRNSFAMINLLSFLRCAGWCYRWSGIEIWFHEPIDFPLPMSTGTWEKKKCEQKNKQVEQSKNKSKTAKDKVNLANEWLAKILAFLPNGLVISPSDGRKRRCHRYRYPMCVHNHKNLLISLI